MMTIARATLIGIAATSAAACATSDIAIRSVPGSKLQAVATPSARVLEGHAKLAMGSVGLAVESFRRALRDDPSNIDAVEGMGMAYEKLGRFDLAARQYEAALAIDPRNQVVLARLAASREADGNPTEAAKVRAELASIRQAQATPSVSPAAVVAQLVGQDIRLSAPGGEPAALRPVEQLSPRLVRLTFGEIALVTRPGPLWERSASRSRQVARPAEILLLNAARVERLAANTKALMGGAGWRNIAVGDAPAVRDDSVIKYPATARITATRLSAQYGIRAEVDPQARFITVYLGKDAAGRMIRG